ncbi:MAG: class II fructose-bisphosphatase [Chloroflexota bacterium]|nr:class II fructose-bisphosphatase [Chloroflexota bacterium]
MAELDRNLAMELVRVTESAALAAARWMGRNEKEKADAAAVDAMRLLLDSVVVDGIVVIGEGEKDHAPMLYNGERIGILSARAASHARAVSIEQTQVPSVDIAVDPIDGTRPLALGLPNALSVVAVAERGSMFAPGHVVYMDKLAVGAAARGKIDIAAPVADNLTAIAQAKGKQVNDLTVVILDRPRNAQYVADCRACGARLKLITDGDVAAGLSTALEGTGVDVLMGIGGSPEGVITASALKCMGGEIQCRLWPRDDSEKKYALEMGYRLDKTLGIDDLVHSDNVFFSATGITDGELLRGVHYIGGGATTDSLVMRSRSGTVRRVQATHRFEKLMKFSQVEYAKE